MKYIIIPIILLLFVTQALAVTYTVDTDAEMDTAVAAIVDDDIIVIDGSFIADGMYIIGADVEIYGSATTNTITLGTDVNAVFRIDTAAAGTTIRDFTLDCNKASLTNGSGIHVNATGVTISGMTINNPFNFGIAGSVVSASTATVSGCTINTPGGAGINHNALGDAIRINSLATGWLITANTINGDNTGGAGIFINGADSNTITNNTITNTYNFGINAYNGADSNTISGNTITDVGSGGVATDSINIVGENCTVNDNLLIQNADFGAAFWGIEFGANGTSDGTVAKNNTIYGTQMDRALAAGGHSTLILEGNDLAAVEYGVFMGHPDGTALRLNLIKVTDGVGVQWDATSAGTWTGNTIHNTIIGLGSSTTGIRYEENLGVIGVSNVYGNIVQGFAKGIVFEDKDDDGLSQVYSHNLYYNNTDNLQKDVASVFTNLSLGTGASTSDPLLSSSYRISSDSPAANSGPEASVTALNGVSLADAFGNSDTFAGKYNPNIGSYQARFYSRGIMSGEIISGLITPPVPFETSSILYRLALDDNAASTSVTNTGTGGNVTTYSSITSSIYDSTYYQEGSGSFLVDSVADSFTTNDNFVYEKFTASFYYRAVNATAGHWRPLIVLNNDLDFSCEENEIFVFRPDGTTGLRMVVQGTGGDKVSRTATNVTFAADQWYYFVFEIDGSVSPWVINATINGTTIEWDGTDWDTPTATLNAPLMFGRSSTTYFGNGYFDYVTVVDDNYGIEPGVCGAGYTPLTGADSQIIYGADSNPICVGE